MANQNAVENSLATTTDSTQQGDVNDLNAAVSPSSNATDVGNSTVQETSPDEDDSDDDGDERDNRRSGPPGPAPAYQAPVPVRSQGELVEALTPVGEADAEQKEVPEGRPYEIVAIVRNTHGGDIEGITQRAKDLIEGPGGAVDNVRTSDVRRFSYPINKEVEGSYVVINARFTTPTVADLDRFFKLEEGVLRHLIVREDI